MKNINTIAILCLGLIAIQTTYPFSVSDTWNQAKAKAQSGYESAKTTAQNAKQNWDNLDESTKNAIIGGTIATAGTAAAAGAGYAGYKAYENNSSVYGPGPSEQELLKKPSLSGSGKTVGQEASELYREQNPLPTYHRPAFGDIYARED